MVLRDFDVQVDILVLIFIGEPDEDAVLVVPLVVELHALRRLRGVCHLEGK